MLLEYYLTSWEKSSVELKHTMMFSKIVVFFLIAGACANMPKYDLDVHGACITRSDPAARPGCNICLFAFSDEPDDIISASECDSAIKKKAADSNNTVSETNNTLEKCELRELVITKHAHTVMRIIMNYCKRCIEFQKINDQNNAQASKKDSSAAAVAKEQVSDTNTTKEVGFSNVGNCSPVCYIYSCKCEEDSEWVIHDSDARECLREVKSTCHDDYSM